MHVADIDALPPTDTKSNRREYNLAGSIVIDTNTADEVQAAVDAGITLKGAGHVRQVIYQNEYFGSISADIEAQRRSAPINFPCHTVVEM